MSANLIEIHPRYIHLNTAIFLEIERGNREWGDSMYDIESRVIASSRHGKGGRGRYSAYSGPIKPGSALGGSGAGGTRSVVFYKPFQSGKCKGQSHKYVLNSKQFSVSHIYMRHLLAGGKRAVHTLSYLVYFFSIYWRF